MSPAIFDSNISLPGQKRLNKGAATTDGTSSVETSIPEVPVTVQRKPYAPSHNTSSDKPFYNPGIFEVYA